MLFGKHNAIAHGLPCQNLLRQLLQGLARSKEANQLAITETRERQCEAVAQIRAQQQAIEDESNN